MRLSEYYLGDPRLILVPVEHLTTDGMSRELAAFLQDGGRWDAARVALFDRAFSLYWTRSSALARRTRTWVAPRLRHVAIITQPAAVRPYAQLLNTSAWSLYDGDFDPERSHPELAAYLFVHGDRLAVVGDVALAALHAAPYWLERSPDECAAFAAAAARATRPDGDVLRAIAAGLPWLRELRHEDLRPVAREGARAVAAKPAGGPAYRPIPGTGLLVPDAIVAEPPKLVDASAAAARATLARYHAAWRAEPRAAIAALCDWLTADAPRLLVTAQNGRVVWEPDAPARLGALRAELRQGDPAAVDSIAEDLRVIDRHTRRFLGALVAPDTLPRPAPETEQQGYSYMHRDRALIAYNLREPGMERLHGPALPYARAMLGARTAHEWSHLVADAGWVPLAVAGERLAELQARFAAELESVVAAAPEPIRRIAAADLEEIAGTYPASAALARLLLERVPDYQANLVAMRFLDESERETYVRHNVRTLRPFYSAPRVWRMLIRYLYEYQYLRFSAVTDPAAFFVRSTWFDEDFFATGILDARRFDALTEAVAALCACWAVDERRFRARDAGAEPSSRA